jgi:hypothetical protein
MADYGQPAPSRGLPDELVEHIADVAGVPAVNRPALAQRLVRALVVAHDLQDLKRLGEIKRSLGPAIDKQVREIKKLSALLDEAFARMSYVTRHHFGLLLLHELESGTAATSDELERELADVAWNREGLDRATVEFEAAVQTNRVVRLAALKNEMRCARRPCRSAEPCFEEFLVALSRTICELGGDLTFSKNAKPHPGSAIDVLEALKPYLPDGFVPLKTTIRRPPSDPRAPSDRDKK